MSKSKVGTHLKKIGECEKWPKSTPVEFWMGQGVYKPSVLIWRYPSALSCWGNGIWISKDLREEYQIVPKQQDEQDERKKISKTPKISNPIITILYTKTPKPQTSTHTHWQDEAERWNRSFHWCLTSCPSDMSFASSRWLNWTLKTQLDQSMFMS